MRTAAARAVPASDSAVVTKAALRAAERLGLSNKVLARALGLSEATVSRMGSGLYVLSEQQKSFELAVLFVRLFRSLDAILGGDEEAVRSWVQSENTALGARPVDLLQTLPGLIHVVGYLDARRALV